jgi:hypothetical protein
MGMIVRARYWCEGVVRVEKILFVAFGGVLDRSDTVGVCEVL